MAMPAVVQLTLWFLAGITLAAGLLLYPLLALVAGLVGAVALLTSDPQQRNSAFALTFGLPAASLGLFVAWQGTDDLTRDCRQLLRDRRDNSVVVTLLQAPVRQSAPAQLTQVGRQACDRPIRLILSRSTDSLSAGRRLSVTGEWWRDATDNPLDAQSGVLLARQVKALPGINRVAAARGNAIADLRQLFGDDSPLAEALLVAQRDGIDPQVKRDFAASGLAHLLAISGTHVALVAATVVLIASLLRLPMVLGGALGAIVAMGYVAFLGAPYPAVRAVIQILLLLLARWLQRPAHNFALLASAALLILVWDPLAAYDEGFQLSFAGLAGIIAWRKPLIDALPHSVPVVLRDAVATTVAASVATTPIAAYHFGQVSLVAVVANLLALPVVTAAVPACATALLLYQVAPGPAQFLADGARLLLVRLEDVARMSAAVPGGHFYVARTVVLATACALLVGWWVLAQLPRMRAPLRRAALVALAGILLPLIASAFSSADRQSLEIHALDVGQGDAVAVRTPRGRWILIDAGPSSDRFNAGHSRVAPFLLKHGTRRIDLLVISHPHLDHYGGVAAVMRMIPTALVLDADSGRAAAGALDAVLAARHRQWLIARPGLRIDLDSVSIEVLYPDGRALIQSDDANDHSLVVRIGYGRFAALFTGDAPAWVEQLVVEQYGTRVDVDLMKAGHHGSMTSNSDAWLAATTPRLVLVSAGRGNRYGHPAPEVLQRFDRAGIAALRTDVDGTISVRAYADGRIDRMRR